MSFQDFLTSKDFSTSANTLQIMHQVQKVANNAAAAASRVRKDAWRIAAYDALRTSRKIHRIDFYTYIILMEVAKCSDWLPF